MAKAKQEESIEKQLWKAADKLRKNIDAAEYKHIVMGLVFLKYISDSFEELFNKLETPVRVSMLGLILKIGMSTKLKMYFLYHLLPDGHFCFPMLNYQISGRSLMRRWMP